MHWFLMFLKNKWPLFRIMSNSKDVVLYFCKSFSFIKAHFSVFTVYTCRPASFHTINEVVDGSLWRENSHIWKHPGECWRHDISLPIRAHWDLGPAILKPISGTNILFLVIIIMILRSLFHIIQDGTWTCCFHEK